MHSNRRWYSVVFLSLCLLVVPALLAQTAPTPSPKSNLRNRDSTPTPPPHRFRLTLISPIDQTTEVSTRPTFQWSPYAGATEYTLVVKKNKKTKIKLRLDGTVICVDGICKLRLSALPDIEPLKPGKTYTWFVKTKIGDQTIKSTPVSLNIDDSTNPLLGQESEMEAFPSDTPQAVTKLDRNVPATNFNDPQTYVSYTHAVVGPNDEAVLYSIALGQYDGWLATPYIIHLLDGIYSISDPIVFWKSVTIYGSGGGGDGFCPPNTICDTIIEAADGATGGILTVNDDMTFEIHNVVFQNGNSVTSANRGAAILSWFDNTVKIYDSKFKDNYASNTGGAIYIATNNTLIIERTVFTNNSAENAGGAIYSSGSTFRLNCVRFKNNTAIDGGGGAIYNIYTDGTPDIIATTSSFIDNQSIFTGMQKHIYNTVPTIEAKQSFWSTPTVVAGEVNYVNAGVLLFTDPSACAQNTPEPIPTDPTLADYGIVLEGTWSLEEEVAIHTAAVETGNALYAHGVDADTSVEAFQIVMVGEGNEIHFRKFNGSGSYCTTSSPNPEPGITAYVDCDEGVLLTAYTIVHEFGHVFDGRTGGALRANVEDPDGAGASDRLNNTLGGFVMGIRGYALVQGNVTDWQRSDVDTDNGWGSAALWNEQSYWGPYYIPGNEPNPTPTSLAPRLIPQIGPCGSDEPVPTPGSATPYPTPDAPPFAFQQNPCTYPDWIATPGAIVETHEGAGDMFLNWVYWKNYGPPPSAPMGTPTPTGFWNYTWRFSGCYSDGCPESTPEDSGDTRANWMDQVMTTLFNNNGW